MSVSMARSGPAGTWLQARRAAGQAHDHGAADSLPDERITIPLWEATNGHRDYNCSRATARKIVIYTVRQAANEETDVR